MKKITFLKSTLLFRSILLFTLSLLLSVNSFSQDNISHELKDHIVYYNVFNSSLISPEIANTYQLIRAKDRVYINVAVVKKSGGYGFAPELLRGVYRNLMQQKFELEFIEIKEATATYYLAPIRFNNEDILHLDITVKPESDSAETQFTITKKLYLD
jgi:hypothetical protein